MKECISNKEYTPEYLDYLLKFLQLKTTENVELEDTKDLIDICLQNNTLNSTIDKIYPICEWYSKVLLIGAETIELTYFMDEKTGRLDIVILNLRSNLVITEKLKDLYIDSSNFADWKKKKYLINMRKQPNYLGCHPVEKLYNYVHFIMLKTEHDRSLYSDAMYIATFLYYLYTILDAYTINHKEIILFMETRTHVKNVNSLDYVMGTLCGTTKEIYETMSEFSLRINAQKDTAKALQYILNTHNHAEDIFSNYVKQDGHSFIKLDAYIEGGKEFESFKKDNPEFFINVRTFLLKDIPKFCEYYLSIVKSFMKLSDYTYNEVIEHNYKKLEAEYKKFRKEPLWR